MMSFVRPAILLPKTVEATNWCGCHAKYGSTTRAQNDLFPATNGAYRMYARTSGTAQLIARSLSACNVGSSISPNDRSPSKINRSPPIFEQLRRRADLTSFSLLPSAQPQLRKLLLAQHRA